MSNFRITELDFDGIKQNLKEFLINYRDAENNLVFSDYDFDASSISILLDILAYNTHYNAYFANMVANEMFLDSAIKRESAVSIAKHLGYSPLSYRSAKAEITFTIVPENSPSSLTLPRFTPFITNIEGSQYTFVNLDPVTIVPNSGIYSFSNIEIVQGDPLVYTFRVDASGFNEKYTIPNKNVDITTLRVSVQDSYLNLNTRSYTLASDISEISGSSEVFFLEENPSGFYEIFFGDNVLGKKLSPGNLVIVQYLSSQGSLCNVSENINQYFSLGASIGGAELNVPILATTNSSGGDEPDSIEEIKFKAPRYRASKNRAVTAEDYKSIILANYPLVESVSVWGGEVNDPPKYGKIIISLKPYSGYNLSDKLKNRITNEILSSKKMLSIIPEFIDPNYLHLTLETTVKYNSKNSKFNSQDIELLSKEAIQRYFKTELQKFDRDFIYSKLSRYVDEIDNSVIGNTTIIRLQKRIMPIVNAKNFYTDSNTIKFANKLISGSIYSTVFNYNLNGEIISVYMKDSITDKNVSSLSLYNSLSERLIVSEIGTVDYLTGVLDIPVLNISGFLDNTTDVRIYARTDNLDIAATKDLILVIDDTVMDTTVKKSSGLVVKVIEE